MFSLAEMWGLRPDGSNPHRHIRKYAEHKRERFLSAAELKRLGEVLNEMIAERIELASAITAIKLLVLTGCRLNEIVKLKWEHVDLDAGALRLPDSKSGAKLVHLGNAAMVELQAVQRASFNPHVIAGTLRGQPLADLQPFWQRLRARAGLKDVRIHDLRQTFASVAVAAGRGLPIIGKLLGHTQVQTTARYAHLAGDTVARGERCRTHHLSRHGLTDRRGSRLSAFEPHSDVRPSRALALGRPPSLFDNILSADGQNS
ncbi:MAG TPA: site-specific integrase [Sphingomicrobium sp.]|jgi:integrase